MPRNSHRQLQGGKVTVLGKDHLSVAGDLIIRVTAGDLRCHHQQGKPIRCASWEQPALT
jgi:hypothetical protein